MKHLKILSLTAAVAMAMMAFGASISSATTIQSGGKNLPAGAEIYSTLKAGTSSVYKDTFGNTVQTCTRSENKVKTTNETGTAVNGVITVQSTSNCSHTAHVLKNGEMKIEWTSGNDGKVSSSNFETTFISTVFGASCLAKTGTGTPVGTLTGSTTGNATMDINAVISAGICGDFVWTASFTVTSPSPLTVVK
jgi:hypothetical protein